MDQLDFELKHTLQSWAKDQPLPVAGRSRLLISATANRKQGSNPTPRFSTSPAGELFSWAMVYCVDRRLSLARFVT
ncbi:MAG: hypothetical protein ACK2UM_17525 [Anaerolineales bacterium]